MQLIMKYVLSAITLLNLAGHMKYKSLLHLMQFLQRMSEYKIQVLEISNACLEFASFVQYGGPTSQTCSPGSPLPLSPHAA